MNSNMKIMPPSIRDAYKAYKNEHEKAGRRKKTTKGAFGKKKNA